LREGGITLVNLANNHSADFGEAARDQTRTVLDDAGIATTGQPEGTITYLQRAGGTVAAIGFGFNQQMNSILDLDRARAIVKEAARHAGVVIVTMHVGAEGSSAQHLTFQSETFLGENRGNPVQFARAMVDAGADVVIGHGPHVMRAMEVRKGRLIAYSLGNFMGYATFNLSGPSGQSGVLRVRLAKDGRLLGGKLTSLGLYGKGVPAPGGQSVATVRALTAADFGTTGVQMDADGTIAAAAE
jgi:poly-gamma-glutamate capsule biosynthesis protein CapA/YwtB (metallophosphatase superfamily)